MLERNNKSDNSNTSVSRFKMK